MSSILYGSMMYESSVSRACKADNCQTFNLFMGRAVGICDPQNML